MKIMISKDMVWNSKIVLAVLSVLLILSFLYHFDVVDGLHFSDNLHADSLMKQYSKEDKVGWISSFSCYTIGGPSRFIIDVHKHKMSREDRDNRLYHELSKDESLTQVGNFPAFRVKENVSSFFQGGVYYVLTNDLAYIIKFEERIGENEEKKLLKEFWISGGDFSYRYYIGKTFYLICTLFLLSLTAVIYLSRKAKRCGQS